MKSIKTYDPSGTSSAVLNHRSLPKEGPIQEWTVCLFIRENREDNSLPVIIGISTTETGVLD